MSAAQLYGIEAGQVYESTDGAGGRVVVRDVTTFAETNEVVVYDEAQQNERHIAAYSLAKVRYYLVDFQSGEERSELFRALEAGDASPNQQRRLAQLFKAMQTTMAEQKEVVRRGRFVVDCGEWRTVDFECGGRNTWLCVQVADKADLSCKATRASALDEAIRSHDEKRVGH